MILNELAGESACPKGYDVQVVPDRRHRWRADSKSPNDIASVDCANLVGFVVVQLRSDYDLTDMATTSSSYSASIWQPIATAPTDRALQLAEIDAARNVHALAFPCRRLSDGSWKDPRTNEIVQIRPTAWREWKYDKPNGR